MGTPIGLFVPNEDQRPRDYGSVESIPRPSHADFTYVQKYGLKASSGGGRSSARETIARVAAGAIAEKILHQLHKIEIVAFVSGAGEAVMSKSDIQDILDTVTRDEVDASATRCPHASISEQIAQVICDAKNRSDSVGGSVTCVIRNVPVGLGEPCFDKLEARLAHAMMSIPATKGFEIGSGFDGAKMTGSLHNDMFVLKERQSLKQLGTRTNNSGGIQGGISNGEHIYFNVAFKPPATISQPQETACYTGDEIIMEAKGRHDPCVVPRAVPIVEAMAALVIMDALAIQMSRIGIASSLSLPGELFETSAALRAGGTGKPAPL